MASASRSNCVGVEFASIRCCGAICGLRSRAAIVAATRTVRSSTFADSPRSEAAVRSSSRPVSSRSDDGTSHMPSSCPCQSALPVRHASDCHSLKGTGGTSTVMSASGNLATCRWIRETEHKHSCRGLFR